jgi:hypothetical protein
MATQSVSQTVKERLTLDSTPWLEQHWEGSGFPGSIWRRLCRVDASVRAANTIAEILAADRQNRGLADGFDVEYSALSARHVEGLGDALDKLLEGARNELDELHDFPDKYTVTLEERLAPDFAQSAAGA